MATYNRQQLSLIANETGFLRDNLEKVIRLTEILCFFEQQELLSQKPCCSILLSFKCPDFQWTLTLTIATTADVRR